MKDPNDFINRLKGYKKDDIKESILKKLKKYSQNPKFEPDNIAKKSKAAMSICQWVLAIDNYAEVMKVINPKQEALGKAEAEMAKVQSEL